MNTIPIKSWSGESEDRELQRLIPSMEKLSAAVRLNVKIIACLFVCGRNELPHSSIILYGQMRISPQSYRYIHLFTFSRTNLKFHLRKEEEIVSWLGV